MADTQRSERCARKGVEVRLLSTALMNERKCICCEKPLEEEPASIEAGRQFGDCIGIVYEATIWRSHGNYGSTIYDPRPSGRNCHNFLELYICDECLKKKKDLVYDVRCTFKKDEEVEVKTFDPKEMHYE